VFSKFFQKNNNNKEEKVTHPTYFIIDFQTLKGNQDTLQNYIKREPNYDLAFCSAWQFVFGSLAHKEKFEAGQDKVNFLIKFLDSIHDNSLQHMPNRRKIYRDNRRIGYGYQAIQGRAEFNYYGIYKDWTSDQKGIEELIQEILDGKKYGFNELNIKLEETEQRLILTENGLHLLEGEVLKKLELSRNKIIKTIIDEYNKGPCSDGSDRLILMVVKNSKERSIRQQLIFSEFLEKIQLSRTNEDKINTIASFMRDLMQLHLYWDGNGRSLFIFANWLLWVNDLPLFYPTNMCVFDANSHEKMYSEVNEGQKRFSELFGNKENLTGALNNYQTLITKLKQLINDPGISREDRETLNNTFLSRELNLLFRQSATSPNKINILKFLLENASILNVDIYEKGKTSGKDALEVAKSNCNGLAVEELSIHWLPNQRNSKIGTAAVLNVDSQKI
jgi:Fic/DOC family